MSDQTDGDGMDDGKTFLDRANAWLRQKKETEEDRARIFAVIGLGTFGGTVAGELMSFGSDVIGVDIDEAPVNAYADTLSQTMQLDARDEDALREAGIGDCDVALVAMSDDLEATVLTVVNLRHLGVHTIWAEAAGRKHHRILMKVGVDRVIHPREEIGNSVAQMLHNPLVRDYASLGNGYFVVNFIVPDALEGNKVSEIEAFDEMNVRVLGVMRGSEFLGDGDCEKPLEEDDKLILLGTRKTLRALAERV